MRLPADWAAVQELIRAFVAAQLAIPAIWREPDGPGLDLTTGYASLKVLAPPVLRGRPEMTTASTSPTAAALTIEADAEFEISVQLHRRTDTAMLATTLVAALFNPNRMMVLSAANVVFTGEHQTTDLAQISGARWEYRTAVDLKFRARYGTTEVVDWIENHEVSVSVDPDGTISGTIEQA